MKPLAPTQKPRGIIVCDSSALFPLMAKLPLEALTRESYQKNPLSTVFDGLVFLAKHGYEVVIPEMVAHEVGDYMRDGENYQKKYFSGTPTALEKALGHRTFFRDITRLQHEGVSIRIQPPLPNDTSPEATFLNTLYRIHVSPISDYRKRGALLDVSYPEKGAQAGDKQIKNYIASLPESDTPIYILSNDVKLQHSFAHRSDVNGLGANAFYEALKHEGFLTLIGINADVLDFNGHSKAHFDPYHINITQGASSNADAKSGHSLDLQKMPFAAAMGELARALKTLMARSETPALTVEGGGEASKPMSRSEQWAAKWNRK